MKMRYNVMLNPVIVNKIDFHAKKLCMSRSELIEKIVYDCLIEFGDDPLRSEPMSGLIDGQIDILNGDVTA